MPIMYGNVGGREHRNLQPLAEKPHGRMKRCRGCGQLLPIERFPVSKDGKIGTKCSTCKRRSEERRKAKYRTTAK